MHFCKNQELTSDAQCCLFNHATLMHEGQRLTRDGLIGIQKSKANVKVETLKGKQQTTTNHKKFKSNLSQDKKRINLSKFSSKLLVNKQDKLCTKQQPTNTRDSRRIDQQPKMEQNSINNRNLSLNYSFGQHTNQKYRPITSARIKIQEQQTSQINQKILQKNAEYNKLNKNLNYRQIQKPPSFHPLAQRCQYVNKISFNYVNPSVQKYQINNTNSIKPRVSIQLANPPKPMDIQQLRLVESIHQKSQLNSNLNDVYSGININIKGVQTLAPTVETDRYLVYSQAKDEKQDKKNIKINSSQKLLRQSSKCAESRLTETVNPDFGRKQLRTVQSFYVSQMAAEQKPVHESVILIDFFNPSQHLRKQIEDKIRNNRSNFSQFYS